MHDKPLPPQLAIPIEPLTEAEVNEAIEVIRHDEDRALLPARVRNFELDTVPKAEWAMRHSVAAHTALEELEADAKAWHAQIDSYVADLRGALDARIELFDGALEQYAKNRRALNEKDKTIKLPSGEIATRKASTGVVHVGNEETFIAWANAALDPEEFALAVKTNPKVLVKGVREIVDVVHNAEQGTYRVVHRKTGSVPPGVYVEPPGAIGATVKPKIESSRPALEAEDVA